MFVIFAKIIEGIKQGVRLVNPFSRLAQKSNGSNGYTKKPDNLKSYLSNINDLPNEKYYNEDGKKACCSAFAKPFIYINNKITGGIKFLLSSIWNIIKSIVGILFCIPPFSWIKSLFFYLSRILFSAFFSVNYATNLSNSKGDLLLYLNSLKNQILRLKLVLFIALILVIGNFSIKSYGSFCNNRAHSSVLPNMLVASGQGDYVGRIFIREVITTEAFASTLYIDNIFKKIVNDKKVKAVIVHINSPGGTVTGSETLYRNLRRLSAEKPTIAVIHDIGTSGAYIAALGCDKIYSQQTSVVGSVGVLFSWPEFREAAEKLHLKYHIVKTSPLKATPNPWEKLSPEVEQVLKQRLAENFKWFKNLVSERRKLTTEQLTKVTTGEVFTGLIAKKYKLIDEIGDEVDVMEQLRKDKIIGEEVQMKDVVVPEERKRSLMISMGSSIIVKAFNKLIKNAVEENSSYPQAYFK